MKGRIKDLATILNCHPYSDSSLIIKAFCPRLGNISIIAKCWRKAQNKSPLQTLHEYELTLYEPSGESCICCMKPAWSQNACSPIPNCSAPPSAERN